MSRGIITVGVCSEQLNKSVSRQRSCRCYRCCWRCAAHIDRSVLQIKLHLYIVQMFYFIWFELGDGFLVLVDGASSHFVTINKPNGRVWRVWHLSVCALQHLPVQSPLSSTNGAWVGASVSLHWSQHHLPQRWKTLLINNSFCVCVFPNCLF